MSTINKKKIKITDSYKNNLQMYNMFLPKYNNEMKKKTPDNQSNLCININSYTNNQFSNDEYILSTTERTRHNNSNDIIFDKRIIYQKQIINDTFLYNLIFHKVEIRKYKYYIFYNQNTFNKNNGEKIKAIINNKEQIDNNNQQYINELEQLENLIARYSIIIFFLIKHQQKFLAKNIFLLMLKENNEYLYFFYKNIFKQIFHMEKSIESIIHGIPNSITQIMKMYSFIIKYSLLFSLTKNKNIYMARYLSLQRIVYKLFSLKSELRGNLILTDIGIKYLYANCLFNSCYFSILSYSPMTIPIKLSELIFKIYEGMNEVIFDKKEKSLLLKASYNYSLFIYINGDNEFALAELNLIKEKLINYYDEIFCSDDEEEDDEKVDVDNFDVKQVYKPIKKTKGSKRKLSVCFKDKMMVKRQVTMKKLERKRGLSRSEKTIDKIKEIIFNRRKSKLDFNSSNSFEPLRQANLSKFNRNSLKKRNIRVEDIKKLFISDVKEVLNKRNRKSSITERDIKNKKKIQNNFEISNDSNPSRRESIIELRSSHTNFRSLCKINKLNVPKYMTDPLLIETELLMCEIELDSKNYKEVYEHFKNAILILFIYKQQDEQNDVKSVRYFRKKLRIISVFLKEIKKYLDQRKKVKKFQVLQKPIKISKTYMSLNKKKIFRLRPREKKSSLYLERNKLLENLDINANTNNIKMDNFYNQFINKKTAEEIQKFFIFLTSLSMYQMKLLNDTQPKREIRNDLPILFNGQFKDSLTSGQRLTLRNIHTMSISRNIILNNPDNLILPTNLNFKALKYTNMPNMTQKKINNSIKHRKFHELKSKVLSFTDTVEYEYFKKIFFSKNINKDLQQFFLDNYSLVMKILKGLGEKEINDLIEKPDLLVGPINKFRKNKSECLNVVNNYLIYYKELKDLRQFIYELKDNVDEEDNNVTDSENNIDVSDEDLIIDDSEYSKSFSLNVSNSSLYKGEDY